MNKCANCCYCENKCCGDEVVSFCGFMDRYVLGDSSDCGVFEEEDDGV